MRTDRIYDGQTEMETIQTPDLGSNQENSERELNMSSLFHLFLKRKFSTLNLITFCSILGTDPKNFVDIHLVNALCQVKTSIRSPLNLHISEASNFESLDIALQRLSLVLCILLVILLCTNFIGSVSFVGQKDQNCTI